MAELKTQINDANVDDFLNTIEDGHKRADCFAIAKLMQQATRAKSKMWGANIVGFGTYHYKYASGREGDWMLIGFSPRKANITLYIMAGFDQYEDLLKKLGKFKTGKSCLYIQSLAGMDKAVLKELIKQSVEHMKKTDLPAQQKT